LLDAFGHDLLRLLGQLNAGSHRAFDINHEVMHLLIIDTLKELELPAIILPALRVRICAEFALRADSPGDGSGSGFAEDQEERKDDYHPNRGPNRGRNRSRELIP